MQVGLFIDHSMPWLAASPDAIVLNFSESNYKRGCLEVKYPYACEKQTIKDACKVVNGFCLVEIEGKPKLSKTHMYFFQVQTQMHVTSLQWCDFFVWSPMGEPFVQSIKYDAVIMAEILLKAHNFFISTSFYQQLHLIIMIISPSDCSFSFARFIIEKQCTLMDSTCKEKLGMLRN